ncbi:ATP synthase subunit s, mitochondrial-like, partial [Uloborus diversus]|uniref:ATP synthase subunit s, mitochondrial-like n=1 Tax=Uloborus diversus TaxID=327109 RepID=UPI0024095E45
LNGGKPSKNNRYFWKWASTMFNKVDYSRIKTIGPDHAAAEWLLMCGARVQYRSGTDWITDFSELQKEFSKPDNYIQAIDASESNIMHMGFEYLNGLRHIESIKFYKCLYVEDICMKKLSAVRDSLNDLQLVSCGNVTDAGILSIASLKNLKTLNLFDLPSVKDKTKCYWILQKELPNCKIQFAGGENR